MPVKRQSWSVRLTSGAVMAARVRVTGDGSIYVCDEPYADALGTEGAIRAHAEAWGWGEIADLHQDETGAGSPRPR